jgi:hypothetical protein
MLSVSTHVAILDSSTAVAGGVEGLISIDMNPINHLTSMYRAWMRILVDRMLWRVHGGATARRGGPDRGSASSLRLSESDVADDDLEVPAQRRETFDSALYLYVQQFTRATTF